MKEATSLVLCFKRVPLWYQYLTGDCGPERISNLSRSPELTSKGPGFRSKASKPVFFVLLHAASHGGGRGWGQGLCFREDSAVGKQPCSSHLTPPPPLSPLPSTAQHYPAQPHRCSPRSWSLAGFCLGGRQRSLLSPVDPRWTSLYSCPPWGVAAR